MVYFLSNVMQKQKRLNRVAQPFPRCCYLVSLWTVTRLSRGLYFLTSSRSGVVLLFFVVV
jgi:hypothetical protein